jgi:hypothetical protein
MTVVLINIEGENTNPEYTDAFASLSIRKQGECLSLQLTNGILLAQHANFHLTLGALEVPESGIKAAEGKRLEFYGAMPPSIKGGMTLKLPLNWPPHLIDHNRLLELDYEPAYRQAAKARTNNNPEHALLSFQPDVPPTTVGD